MLGRARVVGLCGSKLCGWCRGTMTYRLLLTQIASSRAALAPFQRITFTRCICWRVFRGRKQTLLQLLLLTMRALTLALMGLVAALACAHAQPVSTIRFTDKTYRKYVGARDRQRPWHNSWDRLSKRGFHMVAVEAPLSQEPVVNVATRLGPVTFAADPPLRFTDFASVYGIQTIWPYCKSISACPVFSQVPPPSSQATAQQRIDADAHAVGRRPPIVLSLPPGASAVDFYVDAAIDCVNTTRAAVSCRLTAQPGDVEVKVRLLSVCGSPFVGVYAGFYDEEGPGISSVSVRCKGGWPTAIGLLRIGSKTARAAVADAARGGLGDAAADVAVTR